MAEYVCELPIDDMASFVSGTTTIPVHERIVRCRDCKHYVPDHDPIDPGWPMMCDDSGRDMVEPYGFCAWGERKAVDG